MIRPFRWKTRSLSQTESKRSMLWRLRLCKEQKPSRKRKNVWSVSGKDVLRKGLNIAVLRKVITIATNTLALQIRTLTLRVKDRMAAAQTQRRQKEGLPEGKRRRNLSSIWTSRLTLRFRLTQRRKGISWTMLCARFWCSRTWNSRITRVTWTQMLSVTKSI